MVRYEHGGKLPTVGRKNQIPIENSFNMANELSPLYLLTHLTKLKESIDARSLNIGIRN